MKIGARSAIFLPPFFSGGTVQLTAVPGDDGAVGGVVGDEGVLQLISLIDS